ncbi:beta strand repeat-containing protein [Aquirufa sp. ROCK-SH2]
MNKLTNALLILFLIFACVIRSFSQSKVVNRFGQEITTNSDASTSSKGIIQLSGDIGGTAVSPTVVGIQGKPVDSTLPSSGQALLYDSVLGKWVPSNISTGSPFYLVGTTTDAGSSKTGNIYRSGIIGATSAGFGSYSNSTVLPTQGLAVSGKLGVGTNGPNSKLDVFSDISDVARFASSTTSTSLASIGLGNSTGAWAKLLAGDDKFQLRNFSNNLLSFHVNLVNGFMGIANTAPEAPLHVTGSIIQDFIGQDANSSGLFIRKKGNASSSTGAVTSGSEIGYHSFLGWNGSAYNRGAYLYVDAAENFTSTAGGMNFAIRLAPTGSTFPVDRLKILSSGKIGIGTSTPAQRLHIAGQVEVDTLVSGAATDSLVTANSEGLLRRLSFSNATKNFSAVSSTVSGIVNNTAGQELGGVDKKINGVDIGKGGGSLNSNTRVGNGALSNNTTGFNSVGLGFQSLFSQTTGSNNVGLGTQALALSTSGYNNVAVGTFALKNLSNSSANTAVGHNSGLNITTGSQNVAIGMESLSDNTTAGNNVAVGAYSLDFNTGGNNTAIGFNSGKNNTTGAGNTILGYRAGENVSTGSNNVLIGSSGGFNITTGSGNISLGNSNLISGSNNTIIGGTTTSLNIGAAFRSQIIALANGIGRVRVFADSLGLVGINTITPAAALDIPSTTSGILVPRMTTAQKNAISVSSGVESLLVYDTDVDMFYFYNLATNSWTPINVGTINTQSGTSYTLTAADNGRVLDFTSSTAITLTVPSTLPVGFQVSITQAGAGQVTFIAGAGMTINNRYLATKTSGQWAKAGLEVRATGSAVLSGDVL